MASKSSKVELMAPECGWGQAVFVLLAFILTKRWEIHHMDERFDALKRHWERTIQDIRIGILEDRVARLESRR